MDLLFWTCIFEILAKTLVQSTLSVHIIKSACMQSEFDILGTGQSRISKPDHLMTS